MWRGYVVLISEPHFVWLHFYSDIVCMSNGRMGIIKCKDVAYLTIFKNLMERTTDCLLFNILFFLFYSWNACWIYIWYCSDLFNTFGLASAITILRLFCSTLIILGNRNWSILVYKSENTAVGIHYTDHMAPSICKLALTSSTCVGRYSSVQFFMTVLQIPLIIKVIIQYRENCKDCTDWITWQESPQTEPLN
jgi:hypothetical protein